MNESVAGLRNNIVEEVLLSIDNNFMVAYPEYTSCEATEIPVRLSQYNIHGVIMKENEIRPKELFEKYLELGKQDGQLFDMTSFQDVECPGCGAIDSEFKFDKNGFNYNICEKCGSLYCSPRPTEDMLKEFYENSQSSK